MAKRKPKITFSAMTQQLAERTKPIEKREELSPEVAKLAAAWGLKPKAVSDANV